MTRPLATAALVTLTGCWGGEPVCPTTDGTVAEGVALSCEDAHRARRWGEALSARPLTEGQREAFLDGLADAAEDDLAATQAAVDAAKAELDALLSMQGLPQAEKRSTLAWATTGGGGPFGDDRFEAIRAAVDASIASWARDDDEKLVLTEMDVEGWIRYASLCREVQGATPLRISVADRVSVYGSVVDRWKALDRDGQLGLVSIGPYWTSVQQAWQAASYERQQGWIRAAPLPPPMTATSLGYLEVLTEGDVERHAQLLHRHLGSFPLVTWP